MTLKLKTKAEVSNGVCVKTFKNKMNAACYKKASGGHVPMKLHSLHKHKWVSAVYDTLIQSLETLKWICHLVFNWDNFIHKSSWSIPLKLFPASLDGTESGRGTWRCLLRLCPLPLHWKPLTLQHSHWTSVFFLSLLVDSAKWPSYIPSPPCLFEKPTPQTAASDAEGSKNWPKRVTPLLRSKTSLMCSEKPPRTNGTWTST